MGKLIPRLLREFDIEWASEKPEWQVFNYWFARQEGLVCRLRSRRWLSPALAFLLTSWIYRKNWIERLRWCLAAVYARLTHMVPQRDREKTWGLVHAINIGRSLPDNQLWHVDSIRHLVNMDISQEFEIKSLLLRERYYRDTQQWDKLRNCYHSEPSNTSIKISW